MELQKNNVYSGAKTRSELIEQRRRRAMEEADASSKFLPGSDLAKRIHPNSVNNKTKLEEMLKQAKEQPRYFRRNMLDVEEKIMNILLWPPTKKFEEESTPFWKKRKGWVENPPNRTRDDLINSRKLFKKMESPTPERKSFLIAKRAKAKLLADKINAVPLKIKGKQGEEKIFDRIALWKARDTMNQRSLLDDPNILMYSSFSVDKQFHYDRIIKSQLKKSKRVQRMEKEFKPEDYIFHPLPVPREDSNTDIISIEEASFASVLSIPSTPHTESDITSPKSSDRRSLKRPQSADPRARVIYQDSEYSARERPSSARLSSRPTSAKSISSSKSLKKKLPTPRRPITPALTIPPRVNTFVSTAQNKQPKVRAKIEKMDRVITKNIITPHGVVQTQTKSKIISKQSSKRDKHSVVDESLYPSKHPKLQTTPQKSPPRERAQSAAIYEHFFVQSPKLDSLLRDRPKSACLLYGNRVKSDQRVVRTGGFQAILQERTLSALG